MVELDPEVEQQIADLSNEDFEMLRLRTRLPGEDSTDPKVRAAAALRRERGAYHRGQTVTKEQAAAAFRQHGGKSEQSDTPATKEDAANALRRYRGNQ